MHWFAILTTVATFALLATGGLVTSKGVGMAVPDWPTTFGYNMFAFPISLWVGGVFWEHFHRLVASAVGLLTVALAIWAYIVEPRRWVKILITCAVVGVIIQGLLGGLRVTMIMKELGIFHGLLAQSFFVTMAIIAVVTSPAFISGRWAPRADVGDLPKSMLFLAGLIFLQLMIGATMRHAHLGLAIPDFPLAYGSILPDTSAHTMMEINAARTVAGEMPTTAFQIWLQMAHRLMAIVILTVGGVLAWCVGRHSAAPKSVKVWTIAIFGLLILQGILGAYTIWTNKAADIATLHMALGALLLMFTSVLTFRLFVMDCGGSHSKDSRADTGGRRVAA